MTVVSGGGTIGGIAEEPSAGRPRRMLLVAGALVGAAAVGLAWLFVGNDGSSSVQGSLASLGQAPGIAPPDYAYLDNARVALYLGQLEGGIAKSEQLTQQLTQGRNAGLSAGSFSVGGSTSSTSSAERVVTPTATARFYQLLDLLGKDGYLHTLNMAASPAARRKAFAVMPEGSFVKLQNCSLRLPSYVQLGQLSAGSGGYLGAGNEYGLAGQRSPLATEALRQAERSAGLTKAIIVGGQGAPLPPAVEKRVARAIRSLDKVVSRNPRVPLSTCDGHVEYKPKGVDLLFPIRLGSLSTERSLLAGPVTVVGKLVRSVRRTTDDYVDDTSLATFTGPVDNIDGAVRSDETLSTDQTLSTELSADTVVLSPGAVILPIAIYK